MSLAEPCEESKTGIKHVLGEPTLEGLSNYIKLHNIRKILCLVGAGVSVGAGIPDFRSDKVGIYSKLSKYNLKDPTEAFSLALLREDPTIFYSIVSEMNLWPGSHKPTAVHHFIKLLADEGRLLRCCTQNVDGLEWSAGLPEELLVEAHGTFQTSSCIDCKQSFDTAELRRENADGAVWHCPSCGGIIKPDIVFFGEQLPERFFDVFTHDTKEADLVLIIGTSLEVRPFALLPMYVRPSIPRVVFNLHRVGGRMFYLPEDDLRNERAQDWNSSFSSATGGMDNEDDDFVIGDTPNDGGDVDRQQGDYDHDRRALGERDPRDGDRDSVSSTSSSEGFIMDHQEALRRPDVCRDLLIRGDCQKTITRFAEYLGLGESLRNALLRKNRSRF
ncbi:unnamed protein product [Phytomonas sp. EM1]|nr:unnamed protein product [Phytomonas sp. EM1]|eukprot:CCW64087.1 unnamed protein product [Phytomonas sp. isolate EM1]